MFGSPLSPAFEAPNRDRLQCELHDFVPVLLFFTVKNKSSATLDALSVLVHVKVSRRVVAIDLFADVTSYRASRHRRFIARVVAPSFINFPVQGDNRDRND